MTVAVRKTVEDGLQHRSAAHLGNNPTEFRDAMSQARWA
jgi:hypothetical protein